MQPYKMPQYHKMRQPHTMKQPKWMQKPFDNDQKGEGLNMCFIFKFWLPEYRTDIALGEENTNLNSKIKE